MATLVGGALFSTSGTKKKAYDHVLHVSKAIGALLGYVFGEHFWGVVWGYHFGKQSGRQRPARENTRDGNVPAGGRVCVWAPAGSAGLLNKR